MEKPFGGYNGKVKCVKIYESYADRGYFLENEYRYDEKGNETYNYWYNSGEKYEECREVVVSQKYEYDKNGNVAKIISIGPYTNKPTDIRYEYNDRGRIIAKYLDGNLFQAFEYNEAGQQTQITNYANGEIKYIITNSYDEKGRLTSHLSRNVAENKAKGNLYQYDNNDHIIIEEEYNGNFVNISASDDMSCATTSELRKTYTNTRIYQYDNKGRNISTQVNSSRFGLISAESKTYDRNGNLKKTEVYFAINDTKEITHYTYDDSGKLVDVKTEKWHKAIEYDENGCKTQEIQYDKDGVLVNIKTFNSIGNIIEEKRYHNNPPIPLSSNKYEYEYYDD